jgi:hypothetical protein
LAGAGAPAPAFFRRFLSMKIALSFSVALLLAGDLRVSAADSVELNGFSCLGGEKLACFLLFQPSAAKPRTFMLAEGESKYGFKLLAVDTAGHQVLMEKCGVKKYVHINSTPELIATETPETEAVAEASAKVIAPDAGTMSSYFNSDETARILAGNPLLPNGLVSGAVKNSNNGTDANSPGSNSGGANSGNQNGAANSGTGGQNASATSGNPNSSASPSGAATDPNNQANELWYQESLSIEQSRVSTADDVASGKLSPFPRTPLTPAATPSQLISEEVYFSDHIPGYKVTGFLNQ